MRIARVLTRMNLGGPARQVLASDPLLARRGYQVRVFAGSPELGEGDLFEPARERGIDVVRVPGLSRGWSLTGDLRARAFLKQQLREFRPAIVHSHASKAGALARSAARGLGAGRVHTFHGHVLEGYFPAPLSRGLIAIERKLARETDRIVAVSHATADDLIRLGIAPPERIVVIPPGVELSRLLDLEPGRGELQRRLGAPPDTRLVAVIGRLAPVKAPERALEILELLSERYPKLQLVFVGDGELRGALERRIRALPPALQERAHMLGAVDDVTPLFADLFAVLLTSQSEGMPVALIEAAAAALPVVSTRVGGCEEIVAEERTGYLGSSVDELAYALARLLDDPAGANAMGQRARLRVASRHSGESLASRLDQLYQVVAQERACAS